LIKAVLIVVQQITMQQEQFYNQASAAAKTATPSQSNLAAAHELPSDLPQCCGTGCVVCVLDYPELFSGNQTGGQADSETLAMLEAIEQAQLQADRLIAEANGEMQ